MLQPKTKSGIKFWSIIAGFIASVLTIISVSITIIDVNHKKEITVSDDHRVAINSRPSGTPKISDEEKRLAEFKSLINEGIVNQAGKPNIAMVIESRDTTSGFSPQNMLYSLFQTNKANLIINLLKEKQFKASGFFGEIYNGNTGVLRQTDALSRIDYLILGKLKYSFHEGVTIDKDLISCDINFSYKVISKNAQIIKADNISVIGPGFSKDAALERGLEILSERYFDRIMKPIL